MAEASAQQAVLDVLRLINEAWLAGRPEDMRPLLHPEIALAPPGFEGRERGADRYIEGHRGFVGSVTLHGFEEREHQVDIVDDSAVATYRYELIYERSGRRYRSLGRDLWVLRRCGGEWLAIWRTILDVDEQAL